MDAQRGIIFIGLAIVSYMMVLAWNDDYGNQPVASTPTVITETPKGLAPPY